MNDWSTDVRERFVMRDDISRHDRHLAIFREPFLQLILQGRKTIESRFSMKRIAPFGVVRAGDVMLLKRSSGPIVAYCDIVRAEFFELDQFSLEQIRARYSDRLCADAAFWRARKRFRYASLLHIGKVQSVPPWYCEKRDRRAWVVLPRQSGNRL